MSAMNYVGNRGYSLLVGTLLATLAACGGTDNSNGGGINTFTVKGAITGLSGTVVLTNIGSDESSFSDNGDFSITTELTDGSTYSVTVAKQPNSQSCSIENGTGIVSGNAVTDVVVTCADNIGSNGSDSNTTESITYSVGGSIIGLSGIVVLTNNGGDESSFLVNGDFGFATELPDGNTYSVAVATQPEGQSCIITNGTGTVSGAVVTDIAVTCTSTTTPVSASLFGTMDYLKASNTGAGDMFGMVVSLSADGSTLAVGAPREDSRATGVNSDQNDDSGDSNGAVYVFVRSEDGAWIQQAYVKASNTTTGDADIFGWTVELSGDGDTLAVGAPCEASSATGLNGDQNDNTALCSGAVYIFIRKNSAWIQQAYVKASNTGAVDFFGGSIALSESGDILVVGAALEDSNATGINGDQHNENATDSGAVYVFIRSEGGTWDQEAYLKASNTEAFDYFGIVELSADGYTLAVGARHEDSSSVAFDGNQSDNSATDSGAVYIFTRNGGAWVQQVYVKASIAGPGDLFGTSLAMSADGDTLAVGAHGESSSATGINGNQVDNAANRSGAVYVFSQTDGGAWFQQAYVKASNTGVGDFFGANLALSADGNALAVGAYTEDSRAIGLDGEQSNDSATDSGAVYMFSRIGGETWIQDAYVKASNTGANDKFGWGLGMSADGGTLAVGAYGEGSNETGINGDQGNNTADQSGAVYVFRE